jgi:hypothetical protein
VHTLRRTVGVPLRRPDVSRTAAAWSGLPMGGQGRPSLYGFGEVSLSTHTKDKRQFRAYMAKPKNGSWSAEDADAEWLRFASRKNVQYCCPCSGRIQTQSGDSVTSVISQKVQIDCRFGFPGRVRSRSVQGQGQCIVYGTPGCRRCLKR